MHNVEMQHDAFDLKLCDQERITNSATIHQPNRQQQSPTSYDQCLKIDTSAMMGTIHLTKNYYIREKERDSLNKNKKKIRLFTFWNISGL